jgi:type IV secretion system protein VirB2
MCSPNLFAGTTALPWEKPLMMIIHSLTGDTAKNIAIISMFVAGGLLVFGGELEDFARRITWLVMAIALMYAGEHVLEAFNNSWAIGVGAVI